MALVVKDRVQETTTTTGTGTLTLAGAVSGFQSFSVIGNGNTTYYSITGGAEWEIGIGTYTASGTTLSRDTVLESSNSGSLVNFSAGSKTVFCTYPAERSMYVDGTTITPATTATLPVASGGTGANTLTSNNVILGNGTSAVQFVAPGTSSNVLTSNGTTWVSQAVSSGGLPGPRAEIFTSVGTSTFTVPTGVTAIKVTVVGGGGGALSPARDYASGGGGGGGVAIEWITGLTPGNTITVTVGGGGTAGNAGGTSSFGAYCSATGGATSTQTTSGSLNAGGAGGAGSGGTFNFSGGKGAGASVLNCSSPPQAGAGQGGGAGQENGTGFVTWRTTCYTSAGGEFNGSPAAFGMFGGMGGQGVTEANGANGTGYGNGGGGVWRTSATARTGGSGSQGIVFVEY